MRKLFRSKYKVTQGFGENKQYYKQFGLSGHEGGDYIPTGSNWNVLCLEDGIVVKDEDNPRSGAYGVYVTVWHSKINKATQYCHLSKNNVSVNQEVKKGQVLGVMGQTGNTTGPHVHLNLYEVNDVGYRLNKDNGYLGGIDPLPFLEEEKGTYVDEKTFVNLVAKSSSYDQVVDYLELGDPNVTSADKVTASIAGIKSSVSACNNNLNDKEKELRIATQETENKKEQLARVRQDCQEKEKLLLAHNKALSKGNKVHQEVSAQYEGRIRVLEGRVDELAKEKGRLQKRLAEEDTTENIIFRLIKKIFDRR